MDFDLDLSEIAEAPTEAPPTPAAKAPVAKPLDFDGISLDLDTPPDLQDAVIEEAGELPTTDFGSSTQDFGKADAGLDDLDDLGQLLRGRAALVSSSIGDEPVRHGFAGAVVSRVLAEQERAAPALELHVGAVALLSLLSLAFGRPLLGWIGHARG